MSIDPTDLLLIVAYTLLVIIVGAYYLIPRILTAYCDAMDKAYQRGYAAGKSYGVAWEKKRRARVEAKVEAKIEKALGKLGEWESELDV